MLPEELVTDTTGVTQKTVEMFLAGKHPTKKIPCCYTLEVCDKTPICIPVDITEYVVKLVVRKLLGSLGTGDTDLESLQGWLLKFGVDSQKLCTSVEIFVDWLSNKSPTWAAHR